MTSIKPFASRTISRDSYITICPLAPSPSLATWFCVDDLISVNASAYNNGRISLIFLTCPNLNFTRRFSVGHWYEKGAPMRAYPSTMSSPYLTGTLVEEVEMFSCSGENMGTVCVCVCLYVCERGFWLSSFHHNTSHTVDLSFASASSLAASTTLHGSCTERGEGKKKGLLNKGDTLVQRPGIRTSGKVHFTFIYSTVLRNRLHGNLFGFSFSLD